VLCASLATIRCVSVNPGQEDLQDADHESRRGAPALGLAADPRAAAPRGLAGHHKRTERLYRLEGQNLRRNRPRRRKPVVARGTLSAHDVVDVLNFGRPEKPTGIAHIESFNARLRAECLAAQVVESLKDAEETMTSWRSDYDAAPPRGAACTPTPREFAELG